MGSLNRVVIGVDPGLTGAIAWVDVTGELVDVIDMPVMDGRVNCFALSTAIAYDPDHGPMTGEYEYLPDCAVVEQVHAMPKNGSVASFKLGAAYGCVLGVIGAHCIRSEQVSPQTWKKHHGLIGKDKDAARAKAIDRWPSKAQLFARKKDCGRADAALIALWHIERRAAS